MNDPVNKYDPTGHFAIGILILIIVGDAVLTTAGAITYGAVTDTPVVLDFINTMDIIMVQNIIHLDFLIV
ncbi:MAG: hypothetical protein PUA88_01695 [Bacillales bacterium]|nr:hypothetical protein [Bacillales bacterium]